MKGLNQFRRFLQIRTWSQNLSQHPHLSIILPAKRASSQPC